MHAVLIFIRNVVALLAIALAGLYLLALIYLFMQQRNFLFARGRNPQAIGGTYHAVHVTEPDGMQILAWYAPPRGQAPTIVFFYGNAGTVSDFADVGKQFHAEGLWNSAALVSRLRWQPRRAERSRIDGGCTRHFGLAAAAFS